MAPDSDLKDRTDRPGQNVVLDAGYLTVYAEPVVEDENDDEEDEDGEGRASFALDTPEPAIPVMTGPEMPGGKVKRKKRKAKKNSKSVMGARFAEIAPVMIDAGEISTALAIEIDEEIFATSAFDRDEVTDTPTDLMNILFSAGGRPWENESLSAAERMAMMKVLRTNFPDAQKRAEREEFEYRIRARSNNVRTANVAAVVVAATKSQAQEVQKPILNTVQKTVTESPASLAPIKLVTPREPFIREYGQPEEIYKADRNLNAALGIGSIIGMPSSLAMLNMKAKPEANQPPANYLGLAEIVASQMPVQPESHHEVQERVTVTPQILSRDSGFVRAMRMIYEAIAPEILMKVAPYREAGWSDKYLEQKENLADITAKKTDVTPIAEIRPHYEMNISVPAFK